MASPHVAGVLALMKSVHPDGPRRSFAKLRQQADDKACAGTAGRPASVTTEDNAFYGEGIVDALDAVTRSTR